jgi:hypothetical protein
VHKSSDFYTDTLSENLLKTWVFYLTIEFLQSSEDYKSEEELGGEVGTGTITGTGTRADSHLQLISDAGLSILDFSKDINADRFF